MTTSKGSPLAQLVSQEYDPATLRSIMRTIEQRLAELEKPLGLGWAVTNHAERRTMDENAVNVAQLAEVVGTLIRDLVERKRLTGSVG